MTRRMLLVAAGILAAIGCAVLAVLLSAGPTTLTIAVSERSEDLALIEALQGVLDKERADVRLAIRRVQGFTAAAQAVEKGHTDLGAVRSDVALPANAHTVVVLHEDAAILVVPGAAPVETIADLSGRRLGVLMRHRADLALADAILARSGLSREEVAVKEVAPGDLSSVLAGRTLDALFMVGPPTDAAISAAVAEAARAYGGRLSVLPVTQAEAMAQATPAIAVGEIVAGSFGGKPPRPFEAVKTVMITHRLVARTSLDAETVADLTRLIFELRPRVAQLVAAANRIEAPDTEKGATLPIHQGASDYLEGDELTFFERYGDWFYIGITVIGFGGSLAAAVASRLSSREHRRVDKIIDRLLAILPEARQATTAEALDALSIEVDALTADAVGYARVHSSHAESVGALSLALDGARTTIAERRIILGQQAVEPHAGIEEPPYLTALKRGRPA